ncbi:hypothetical protein KK137_09200 [Croceibacterium sp. LX-88]|uniref:Uncharacterized protein n=1 Tax=Croceibacterium selenioxidans TaxID=2838833 RepID=A0ABS5W432_9SPHN|nr:hypothetical protein [Croceibacterium selenioxidans]MBT2134508.1 hypothetical protein [Croceibacterium selenioxidans]
MADAIPPTNVFKFVALRPPTPPRDREGGFIRDRRDPRETPVGRLVAGFRPADAARIPELVRAFIERHNYDLEFPQSAGDTKLDAVEAAALSLPATKITTQNLREKIESALGLPLEDFLGAPDTQRQLDELWDRYYAFVLLGLSTPQNLEHLTRNLRIFHLLQSIAAGMPIDGAAGLARILSAQPVVDKFMTTLPQPAPPAPARGEEREEAPGDLTHRQLWTDLVNTHAALREVRSLPTITRTEQDTDEIAVPDTCSGRETKTQVTRVELRQEVDPEAFRAMSEETQDALSALRVTQDNFRLPTTLDALSGRLDQLNYQVRAADPVKFLEQMPPGAMQVRELNYLANSVKDTMVIFPIPTLFPNIRGSIKPLGIGDLKVVKQTLKKYAAGEVAHIENVLRGEYKERKHRVLDRVEETITTEVETEEETLRDTQTTDRFELKRESEKTIQEQMSVQAGVTVTASYGPVTFGAHGDFAYSTSTTEATKNASNYAREVVDRSVSRIQKKTREERIRKTLHEVEELNTHGIDNKDKPDHVTGVYRWVDKYYQAQIYNYGKRMMLEFIVPEPAAFLAYAQTHKPVKDVSPPKPLPKNFRPYDLDDWNYHDFIRDYGVEGCVPPPPEFKLMSASMASEGKIEAGIAVAKTSKDLVIPAGYIVQDFAISVSVIHTTHPSVKVSIGRDDIWWVLDNSGFNPRRDGVAGSVGIHEGIVPFSINVYDVHSYFLQVMATCVRRWETYEAWQIQTYEKIRTAHKALQAEYEEKLAAREVQAGVVIQGQNPRINREIEETELKKQCVQMLMDTWTFGSFDAMKQSGSEDVPSMDIFDALKEGKQVQFFEQAFEWENLTYLFYPYFWGRESTWVEKVTTFDVDPLFTRFLQAGSARVLVPVHTAYNDAVMYYLENGAIWGGGDAPKLDDPLFISLADELRNQTDDLANAKPEGDPWEVVLPTTLVHLQAGPELPTFP